MKILSYKSSFLISLISKGVFSVSGIVSLWIITIYCTMQEVGQYALTFMVLNIFYIFSRFGLPELLMYEFTKKDQKDVLFKNILALTFIFSFIGIVIIILLSNLLQTILKSNISIWLYRISIALPFMVIVDLFLKWYQSNQNIYKALIPSNIFRPILFMFFLYILFNFSSLEHKNIIIISFILSYILISLYYFTNSKILPNFDYNFIKQLDFKHAFNNVVTLFLVSFLVSIDSFMISHFYTDVEVAIYQVAIKVIMIATIFNMVIEPLFTSRLIYHKSNNSIRDIENEHKKISIFGIFYWIVLFIVFALYGKEIFSIFGSYEQSLEIFFIFMIGRIFDLSFGLSSGVLNIYRFSRILLKNTLFLLFLNFILNYIFIQYIGMKGVAYATALVFIIQALLRTYQIKNFIGIHLYKLYLFVIPLAIFNFYYIKKVF